MVQFLSINFFSWISSIFVGFFKSSFFFCVTLCVLKRVKAENIMCNSVRIQTDRQTDIHCVRLLFCINPALSDKLSPSDHI